MPRGLSCRSSNPWEPKGDQPAKETEGTNGHRSKKRKNKSKGAPRQPNFNEHQRKQQNKVHPWDLYLCLERFPFFNQKGHLCQGDSLTESGLPRSSIRRPHLKLGARTACPARAPSGGRALGAAPVDTDFRRNGRLGLRCL